MLCSAPPRAKLLRMTKRIPKAELARWCGVARSTVTRACRTTLADACTSQGVNVDHPLVKEWLRSHGVHAPVSGTTGAEPAQHDTTPPVPAPVPMSHDLEHLEELTVREVVMRYGSVDGFKRFVDSLKSISEYKYKELRAKQQRGDLVDRQKVAGLVFPLLDVAFARLVTDVPVAVSKAVVARVESGGPDTYADVQKIIRDANSRVLKNAKQAAMGLEILNDAD